MSHEFFGAGSPFDKWPSMAGAGHMRPKPAPEPALEPDSIPVEPPPPPESKPRVEVTNPEWAKGSAEFNEAISVSAHATLPPAFSHLTRLEFKLWAILSDGKRELLDKKDGFIDQGKATLEMTAFWPAYRRDGKLLEECDLLFTVKHRESKEVESATCPCRAPIKPIGKAWIRFVTPNSKPIGGVKATLKGAARGLDPQTSDENGEVIWENIPLANLTVEFRLESHGGTAMVPWLAVSAHPHLHRMVRE